MIIDTIVKVVQMIWQAWKNDDLGDYAATLSFYFLFSIAPLIAVIVFVIGLFFGEFFVQSEVIDQVNSLFGAELAEALRYIIDSYQNLGNNLLSAVINLAVLLFSATRLFSSMKTVLNKIWNIEKDDEDDDAMIISIIIKRLLSVVFLFVLSLFLLMTFFLNSWLSNYLEWLGVDSQSTRFLLRTMNLFLSVFILTIIIGLIFKYLPYSKAEWHDVWVGSFSTAILFVVGQVVIGFYLSQSSIASAYGISGSLISVMIWVYYSMYILLIGAEFTQIYSHEFGTEKSIGELSE